MEARMSPGEVDDLLETWEAVYKKGLLSFWMLLLLDGRPSYAFEMRPLIEQLSQGSISADDNSLYRALNRFEDLGIVASEVQPSPNGPARRYYRLSPAGQELLRRFIQRNLVVFEKPEVAQAMAKAQDQHDH
jgi:PadR family transcriptional regulator, regulatory protein PadR